MELLYLPPWATFLLESCRKPLQERHRRQLVLDKSLLATFFVAPIQAAVYLASMAVINGLRQPDAIVRTVKTRFFTVLKVSWTTSPLAIIVAQNFLPQELWVPWFNFVAFVMGTYFNMKLKRMTFAAQKKRTDDEGRK